MTTLQIVQMLAIDTGYIAALALFVGAFCVPFEKQSWKSSTEFEIKRKRRQKLLNAVGLTSATLSVAMQVWAVFIPVTP
jgi:hypothetical protein